MVFAADNSRIFNKMANLEQQPVPGWLQKIVADVYRVEIRVAHAITQSFIRVEIVARFHDDTVSISTGHIEPAGGIGVREAQRKTVTFFLAGWPNRARKTNAVLNLLNPGFAELITRIGHKLKLVFQT